MRNTLLKLLLSYLLFTLALYSKVTIYENADSNVALGGEWTTDRDILPKRTYNLERGSGSVYIQSRDLGGTLYKLKINNKIDNVIQWDISMRSYTSVYIKVRTRTIINGKLVYTHRYFHYYPKSNNETEGLIKQGYIKIGIGKNINDGKWHTIRRDLIRDLNKYDPASTLISIEEFLIRGEAELDNIETMSYRQYEDGTAIKQFHSQYTKDIVNHEKIDNWHTYDGDSNASVTSVYDDELDKNVVQLSGNGHNTGFALKSFFNYKNYTTIQWSMKYKENFTVYIKVNTQKGIRYLSYNNKNVQHQLNSNNMYLYLGLGRESINNKWHTFTRDLNKDVKRFDENNKVTSVIGFLIRGSGYINNIFLLENTDIENDPIYAHKHYYMDTSGLSLNGIDAYTFRVSERHGPEEGAEEGIVLYQKSQNDINWSGKILLRGGKKIDSLTSNISPIKLNGKILKNKIILKYKERFKKEAVHHSRTKMYIYDLEKEILSEPIELKLDRESITYGNTLITPNGKILFAGYTGEDNAKVYIYRSEEPFNLKKTSYKMNVIKTFKDTNQSFLEPVLSYSFDKLTIAIRKDTKWFDQRNAGEEQETLTHTSGEIYYTTNKEGGDKNTLWIKKVLPDNMQINGMFIPPYQNNYFLMIASDGGNRQKIITLNINAESSLEDIANVSKYNKEAVRIEHKNGGGYPAYIRNDDEAILIYWEETNDRRGTKMIRKDIL